MGKTRCQRCQTSGRNLSRGMDCVRRAGRPAGGCRACWHVNLDKTCRCRYTLGQVPYLHWQRVELGSMQLLPTDALACGVHACMQVCFIKGGIWRGVVMAGMLGTRQALSERSE